MLHLRDELLDGSLGGFRLVLIAGHAPIIPVPTAGGNVKAPGDQ
ncbi:hypothetical protein ACFFX0_16945 [Citricoccus parietis]|uniref:Uncharacterized protein n=1 Tax=Citricoccus parietis TaxID=592307 RepID=A0ABV5G1I6_9MICC